MHTYVFICMASLSCQQFGGKNKHPPPKTTGGTLFVIGSCFFLEITLHA